MFYNEVRHDHTQKFLFIEVYSLIPDKADADVWPTVDQVTHTLKWPHWLPLQ